MKPPAHMLAALVGAAAFSLAPLAQSAVEAAERAQLHVISAREALGSRTLPILRRLPAPGSDAAAARALEVLRNTRFAPGTTAPIRRTVGDAVMFVAPDWMLEVRENGDRLRCWGRGFTRRPVPAANQPGYQDVIDRGRRMLENELSPLVPLGPGEELVPVSVTYPGQATVPRNGPPDRRILENHAHFGRLVNGVAVVGYGSKAVVMLDNDGNLLGFDLDWSAYEVRTRAGRQPCRFADINARLIEPRQYEPAAARPAPAVRGVRLLRRRLDVGEHLDPAGLLVRLPAVAAGPVLRPVEGSDSSRVHLRLRAELARERRTGRRVMTSRRVLCLCAEALSAASAAYMVVGCVSDPDPGNADTGGSSSATGALGGSGGAETGRLRARRGGRSSPRASSGGTSGAAGCPGTGGAQHGDAPRGLLHRQHGGDASPVRGVARHEPVDERPDPGMHLEHVLRSRTPPA